MCITGVVAVCSAKKRVCYVEGKCKNDRKLNFDKLFPLEVKFFFFLGNVSVLYSFFFLFLKKKMWMGFFEKILAFRLDFVLQVFKKKLLTKS